jgi:hypothetical protein
VLLQRHELDQKFILSRITSQLAMEDKRAEIVFLKTFVQNEMREMLRKRFLVA